MKAIVLSLCACLLAGCASTPVQYYQLAVPLAPPAVQAATPSVQIGPLTVPTWLERPQLARSTPDGQLHLLPRAEWAAPLSQLMAASLAASVGRDLGWGQVRAWPSASPYPTDWTVTLEVQSLTVGAGQLQLAVSWQVWQETRLLDRGQWQHSVPLSGEDAPALVAAHDQALAALAQAIAEHLRVLPR